MLRPTCLTLLLSVALTAGCGSQSQSTTTGSAGGASSAEYGRRAGAILRPAGSMLAKSRVEMTRAGTASQAHAEARRARQAARSARVALARLAPPGAVASQHRALLSELDEVAAQADRLDRLASRPRLSAFLKGAAAFENGPVFRRLGATIDGIQASGVDLGLGQARP